MISVEVRLAPESVVRNEVVQRAVHAYIESSYEALECDSELTDWRTAKVLDENVERMYVAESGECEAHKFLWLSGVRRRSTHSRRPSTGSGRKYVPVQAAELQVHTYQPAAFDSLEEFAAGDPDVEEGEPVMAATVADLPNKELDGIWRR